LPAGALRELADVKGGKEAPLNQVKVASDPKLQNTGTQPAKVNNDAVADNVSVPGAQVTAAISCPNCKASFTPSAQTFTPKNSIDFYEVAADNEHKCPGCKCIVNKAGEMKFPPQITDFNLSCPNCSSHNWKILSNEPDKACVNCMNCSKKYALDFKKADSDPLRSKLMFATEGVSNCPQCMTRIPYSTTSNVATKGITCPKCDLHYALDIKKATTKRMINRANEIVSQEENERIGGSVVKASVENLEVALKDQSMKNQPVKIRANQDITDVMASAPKKEEETLKSGPDEQMNLSGGLFLVRHGKTAMNNADPKKDKIRGWKNVPLSQDGLLEAKETANSVKGQKIDSLYSSDLQRAYDTAAQIGEATGTKEINKKFDLRPWNVGTMAGEVSASAKPKLDKMVTETPKTKVQGGESFNNFKARTLNVARKLLDEAKKKKVVAVTHDENIKLIKAWIANGMKDDSINEKDFMDDSSIHTGSIHKVEPTDKGMAVREVKNLNTASIEITTKSSDKGESKMENQENKEIPVVDASAIVPEVKVEVSAPASVAPVADAPVVADVEDTTVAEVENAEAVEAEELLEVSKTLKAEDRNALKNSDFAVVKNVKGKDGKTITVRKYPIHDKAHAANALARLHQGPSREGLKKLGVDPDSVITKVKAKAKALGMNEAEMDECCIDMAAKDRSMQPTTKRNAEGVNEPQPKDQNNYVGASIEKPVEAKKVTTGDNAVEGITPDQEQQMQNQLFANMKKASKFRKAHRMTMKNIKALKKAMDEGCFASVSEIEVTANMEIVTKKAPATTDVGTGEKVSEAVTVGTKDVPAADPIVTNLDENAGSDAVAKKLVPEKVGGMVDPIAPETAPVVNVEIPASTDTTVSRTDTKDPGGVVDPSASDTGVKGLEEVVTTKKGSDSEFKADQNVEAQKLAEALIPVIPGDASQPGSTITPIEETALTSPVQNGFNKASVEAMQKENEALKEKVQLLETAAVKIAERKLALGEYGKDLSDKDILNDEKFEVAKQKVENAVKKSELNTASSAVAETIVTEDNGLVKSLKAEIELKANKILNIEKK
jgi:probable phosphoglycerate mutase